MRLHIITFVLLALILTAQAENYVAINSMDGRDILSGIFYANVKNMPVKFMPYPGGNADIFASKIGSGQDVLLIQGSTPVSSFVETSLRNKGNSVEVYTSTDAGATNLDLAKRSGATKFIIVDSAYSDSAISVLPYAAMTDSYVILADKGNIGEVKNVVKDAEKITIFGLVDQEVKAQLAEFNPEILGKGEDKYEDNLLMVQKVMDEYSIKRMIIVDGTFMEDSMALGDQPILLSGRLVPQSTYDFIKQRVKDDELINVMLLGNDLVVPVYDMRERMEQELFQTEGMNKTFGITVKFAQVIPSAGTGVVTLDTFRMPAYQPKLNITEVVYNTQSKKVMVSVGNLGDGSAYYSQEVRIRVNGVDAQVFGENQTKLIERGEQLGTEYTFDMATVPEGEVTALVLVKYGSSMKTLEDYLSKEGPLATITYTDTSNVTVQYAKYDKDKKSVLVTIKNNGAETAYTFSKLNLVVAGAPTNITAAGTKSVDAGSLVVEEFPLQLSDADLAANKNVNVFVDYGGRPGFLLKHTEYVVQLEQGAMDLSLLLMAGGVFILLALVAYYLMTRKPKGEGAKKG